MEKQELSALSGICYPVMDSKSAAPSRITPYVKTDDVGVHNLYLTVEGVHCAACIQKIESAIRQLPGIHYVRLNFSTRRLNIMWHGDIRMADKISEMLSGLAYKNSAYDPEVMNRSQEAEARFLLLCLGVAGFAAGNIMLVSFALWTTDVKTMGIPIRDFLHWISAMIAIPAVAFSGRPFFMSAWNALSAGRTNMDVPISVGLLLTTGMSLFELATHGEHAYFDSAVMLMFFLLIGRYLDFLARSNARKAASDLLTLMSGTAILLKNDQPESILIRDILPDMELQISMGEYIPADGLIIEGQTDIDTSLVTGESIPCTVQRGDHVLSGTLNLSAPIKIRVLYTPENSQIGGMVRLMEKAEQSHARYVRIADRVARLYTPVVHALALMAFVGWVFMGHLPWQESLLIAATVLIITCPCALALAVPIVQVLAVGQLMKRGIMVRSGDVLERLATIDTIIFDKTGTLTQGKPVLINAYDIPPDIFSIAASMAVQSRHPLSQALAQAYQGDKIALTVEELPGQGLITQIDGQIIKLGRRAWVTSCVLPDHPDTMEIVFSVNGEDPVLFLFRDQLRHDACDVISQLKDRGMALYLLSGDRPDIVSRIAQQLGLEHYQGNASPADKFKFMEHLQTEGHKVMMVGDGINDAPVLAGADVSVSPSSGIDIARNAASVVFTGESLVPLLRLLDTGIYSQKLVRQNFGMTVIYNILAIPLAIGGFVTPLIAALAMSLSSLAVTLNAFRLRKLP